MVVLKWTRRKEGMGRDPVEQAVVEHEAEQVGIVQQPRFVFFFCRCCNWCLLV
jgi:hypothetical protein